MLKRDASPLYLEVYRGLPIGYKVLFMARATPSADPVAVNLTGWTVANALCKAIESDEDEPDPTADTVLTITATIPDQSGDARGHIYLTATGAVTETVEPDRAAFDVLLTSPNGTQYCGALGQLVISDPLGTAAASSSAVNTSDLIQVITILAQGPSTEELSTAPIEIDLTQAAGTAIVVYTSTADGVTLTAATLRLTTVSNLASVPRVTIRKTGGSDFHEPTTLVGLTSSGNSRVFPFSGVVPVLNTGDTLEVYVNTAAVADVYTCEFTAR